MVDHSFFALSNTYVLMKVVSKHFFISTAPKSNNKRTKVYSYVYNVSKASKNLFGTILQRKKPNQFFFFFFAKFVYFNPFGIGAKFLDSTF